MCGELCTSLGDREGERDCEECQESQNGWLMAVELQ